MFGRVTIASAAFWAILTVPWCAIVAGYVGDIITYGEFLHLSGDMAAWLLMLVLAVTPLRLMFPGHRWIQWWAQRRRNLGVASFAYAAAHLAAYVIRLPMERILREAVEPGMAVGWVAMAIFLPLALTSNNWAVRALGPRWKALHRAVYVAAALLFAHWLLTAFDPTVGAAHLTVLAIVESYRIWKVRQGRQA